MGLTLINSSSKRMPKKFLRSWWKGIMGEIQTKLGRDLSGGNLTVVFLDAPAARKLNFQHRRKNYATDVLSFEPVEEGSWGELVICPQVIARQAKEHGLSYQEELGYMVLHGCLHLLGFDHEKSASRARKMFRLQDGIFDVLCRPPKPARK